MTTTPRVVGIDPSLTRTTVWCDDGPVNCAAPKGITGPARIAAILNLIAAEVADAGLVVVEGYSHASRHQAHHLGELGGAIRLHLWEAAIPYRVLAPTGRAMLATGKGNASKAAVVSAVAARTGFTFDTDDEVDALVLYCAGRELLGLPHPLAPLPKTHRRALDRIGTE